MLSQVSCASVRPIHDGFDPEFDNWKKMFIHESKGKVTEADFDGVTMGFYKYKDGESTVGTCWPMVVFTEIDISEEYKTNYDYYWRKELVYHEFGHCILGREHTQPTSSSGWGGKIERLFFRLGIYQPKGYLKDGCPISLMHPNMIGSYCFAKHHDYYIAELFANYNPSPMFDHFDSDFGFDSQKNIEWLFVEDIETPFRRPQSVNNQCGPAKIINKTETWNDRDRGTLKRAHLNCVKRYNGCLKKFTKTSELSYQAICGE